MDITLTKEEARKFLIAYHHLHRSNPLTTPQELMTYIKKVGCIQYDPINVLAYNSHLVLQSKYQKYTRAVLDTLLYEDYTLIDGWDKNLSIYAVSDDPFYSPYRNDSLRYYSRLSHTVHDLIPTLKDRIERQGPISSLDIKEGPIINWAWAPTKAVRAALDYMFHKGEIFVHHKVNTRKYYDLIEHHPSIQRGTDLFESEEAYHDWHLERRIGGVGMLPALKDTYGFIAVHNLTAKARRSCVDRLQKKNAITQLSVVGVETPYYIRTSDLKLLDRLEALDDGNPSAKIIAPLDNLIWDRDMIEELFDFKYRWEVYVPEAKRVYGYYVLPILYGYDFIGRIVMKYNRKTNTLEIHNLFFEEGYSGKVLPVLPFVEMFYDFKEFLGAEAVTVLDHARNRTFVRKVVSKIGKYPTTS